MQDTLLIQERKRKFLLMIPVLTVPFIVFLFYALGGGKGNGQTENSQSSALSTTLPDPLVNDQQKTDKLSLYERASRDSGQPGITDPFGSWKPDSARSAFPQGNNAFGYSPDIPLYPSIPPLNEQLQKSREAQMEEKIQQLQNRLEYPDEIPVKPNPQVPVSAEENTAELARLESMMQSLSQPAETNPELMQAGNLLDKILDVQHPDRVSQRLKKQSLENKGNVFPVTVKPEKEISDVFTNDDLKKSAVVSTGFYDEDPSFSDDQNAIQAVVHESQTLVTGATIKIRLEQDAYIQGQLIPKGSFVFGTCTLNGERLGITFSSIRKGNSIYPVSLIAYDLDGLPGIRIPGSINRDASKESSERAIQSLSIGSLDPSIGAQAASAGIEAAKNLLSRKVKLVKVVVKAGYPLLIAPDKNNS